MLTEEAKKIGKEFSSRMFKSGISPSAICTVSIMLTNSKVEKEETYRALLEATKDCRTDVEYLSAVRATLETE